MISRVAHLAVLAACILACGGPTEVSGSGRVEAYAEPSALAVRNNRWATIYVFVVDAGEAARINWAACTDPTRCDGILPHELERVPSTRIFGWEKSGPLILYWWHLVAAAGGGFRADSIRAVGVLR